jgi:hypothetical protein
MSKPASSTCHRVTRLPTLTVYSSKQSAVGYIVAFRLRRQCPCGHYRLDHCQVGDWVALWTMARQRGSNYISDLVDREAGDDDCDSGEETKIYLLQSRRCRNRKYQPRDHECSQPELESQNKTSKCTQRP